MILFPAIDILDRKLVRLKKGNYSDVTDYTLEPSEVAKGFERDGAQFIHTVDLNAAKSGSIENLDVIRSIVESVNIPVETGGGIRSIQAAKRYFDIGVERVIVGTAAVENREFLDEICEKYPNRVSLSLDVMDRDIYVRGWTDSSGVNIFDFLNEIQHLPIASIIVTDISRDGMLEGPGFSLYRELMEKTSYPIVASGGVSTAEDVKKLSEMHIYGAIIGKALYEKKISLKDVL